MCVIKVFDRLAMSIDSRFYLYLTVRNLPTFIDTHYSSFVNVDVRVKIIK